MHDIAQKQIFFFKLPELDLDPDLVVKFPDPDPTKRSGSGSGSGSATLVTGKVTFNFNTLSNTVFYCNIFRFYAKNF